MIRKMNSDVLEIFSWFNPLLNRDQSEQKNLLDNELILSLPQMVLHCLVIIHGILAWQKNFKSIRKTDRFYRVIAVYFLYSLIIRTIFILAILSFNGNFTAFL